MSIEAMMMAAGSNSSELEPFFVDITISGYESDNFIPISNAITNRRVFLLARQNASSGNFALIVSVKKDGSVDWARSLSSPSESIGEARYIVENDDGSVCAIFESSSNSIFVLLDQNGNIDYSFALNGLLLANSGIGSCDSWGDYIAFTPYNFSTNNIELALINYKSKTVQWRKSFDFYSLPFNRVRTVNFLENGNILFSGKFRNISGCCYGIINQTGSLISFKYIDGADYQPVSATINGDTACIGCDNGNVIFFNVSDGIVINSFSLGSNNVIAQYKESTSDYVFCVYRSANVQEATFVKVDTDTLVPYWAVGLSGTRYHYKGDNTDFGFTVGGSTGNGGGYAYSLNGVKPNIGILANNSDFEWVDVSFYPQPLSITKFIDSSEVPINVSTSSTSDITCELTDKTFNSTTSYF